MTVEHEAAHGVVTSEVSDRALYERMESTLIASFATFAAGSTGAAVERVPGAVVTTFPSPPERAFYNNAVLARGLDVDRASAATSDDSSNT